MTSLKNRGFRKNISHLTGLREGQWWQWAETRHEFSGRSYLAERPLASVQGFPLLLLPSYLSLTHWFQRPAVLWNRLRVVGAQESSPDCQRIWLIANTGLLGDLRLCSHRSPNVPPTSGGKHLLWQQDTVPLQTQNYRKEDHLISRGKSIS